MGRLITLIFIVTAYLGPQRVFGPLVEYHIQLILALLAILISLPRFPLAFRSPQSVAMLGLIGAVFISMVANRWLGGAIYAVDTFLPQAAPFFLVLVNFRTKRHIQYLVVVLLAISLFIIVTGYRDLQESNFASPFLLTQDNDKGQKFYRLRGETFIGDPNDFAQVLVCLIPLTFVFWTRKHRIGNLVLVYIPTGLLIFGMYLTHSRGGVLALLALLLVAGRKKLGKIGSALLAGLGFLATMASGWTGGREISVGSGQDRMDAWSEGLQLIKTHPFFGVGFEKFTEFYYITAHNTIVVCAAELGIFGLFFWVLFVIPCLLYSWRIANSPTQKQNRELAKADSPTADRIGRLGNTGAFGPGSAVATHRMKAVASIITTAHESRDEVVRLAEIMLLTLTGFLVAGWFISRSYVMTLFILGALSEVVYGLAADERVVHERISWNRLLKMTAAGTIGLLMLVYLILRVSNLTK